MKVKMMLKVDLAVHRGHLIDPSLHLQSFFAAQNWLEIPRWMLRSVRSSQAGRIPRGRDGELSKDTAKSKVQLMMGDGCLWLGVMCLDISIVMVLIRKQGDIARAHGELTLPLNDVRSRQDSSYLKNATSGSGWSYFWNLSRGSVRKVRAHTELTLLLK